MQREEKEFVLELHRTLVDLDPSRWRADMGARLTRKLTALRLRVARLQRQEPSQASKLRTLQQLLDEDIPDDRARWTALHRRLQVAYEDLRAAMKVSPAHVPSLRATRYRRSLGHVAFAVGALLLAEVVLPDWSWQLAVVGGATTLVWTAEIVRRIYPSFNDRLMTMFGATAHPHERHQVNSATWYTTALLVLALTASPAIAAASIAILGVGDPIAGLVGRRWGRIKLLHGRTVLGTTAFFVSGTLAALAALSLWYSELGWHNVGIAMSAAFAGAVAELVVQRIDDNLAVPLAAALGASAWFLLTGLPFT